VAKGERIGMIKLGSRTDLLISPDRVKEICVKVGDMVKGAETVLLRLHQPAALAAPSGEARATA
jgi:hypothetical protein